MLKRIFALFLAMSMVFSMLPVSAFAADDEHVMETIEETEVLEEVTEEVTVPEETEAPTEETEPAEEEPAQPEETEEVPVIEEPEETPDEEPENEAAVRYEHITWINPLYRDVVTEDDLIPYEPGQIAPFASTAVYSTVDQAGAYVRSLMVRRESAVSFSLRSTSTDYNALFESIMASAEAHTGNPKEGDYLKFQYAGWSGGLSISGDVMTFDIAITYYTTAAQEAKVDTAVANVLNSLNLDGQTPYERTCRIYKYICDHVTYDNAHLGNEDYKLQFTAYAALMNGTSVCQGYAVLLYRLALESGIDCRVIPGIGNGGPHAWNILKLGNNYYNMDATWDADRGRTVDSFVYFLRCNANFPDHYRETEYTTSQFNTAYPMASKNYRPETTAIVASGTCGDNLTWTLDDSGTLTISGSGDMTNFIYNTSPWRSRRGNIKTILIENGVTTIGSYAFYECSSLTSVAIGSGVTTIGNDAFSVCSSLTSITIPDSVTSIGDGTFHYCSSLTSITIPDSVTIIGEGAFSKCSSLKSVTIGNGVTSIGSYAFYNCSSLKEIYFSGNMPSIGSDVFSGVNAKVYYPCGNTTWKSSLLLNYGGSLEWIKDHNYATVEVVPATCTEQGYTKHTCVKCADSYKDTYTQPTGHTEVVDKAVQPTCTEAGKTEGKHCSVCNTVLVAQKTIPATGHTEVVDKAVEPTCTEPGLTQGKHCSVCNAVTVAQKTIPATGHTEVIDKGVPATCTTAGVSDGKHCSVCKVVLVEQKVIPATGHTEVVDKAVAPTCTKDGLTEGKHCSTCGTVLVAQRTIPANGHTEVVDKAVAATCTEAGKTEGKHCSVCNTVLVAQKTIPATGHTEVVDKAVEPTCTEDGKTQGKHCSVCNAVTVAQKTIPATGHTEVTDKGTPATCTAPGVTDGKHCSVCKAVLVEQKVIPAKGHTEVVDQAVAAACTETGLTEGKHCSVCNAILVKQEVVPATGHTVVTDPAVDATCDEDGKTAGKHCFVCGTVLEEQKTVKALGHDYVGTATAPTCTEEGYTTFTCTRCADSFVTYRVPALGHYYNGWLSDSESHWQRCAVCGENTEKIAHTPDRPEATSDTDQLCEICGYVMQSKHTIVRISGPVTLKGGASAAYTAKVEAAAPLADSTILWKLRSEDAAFASITAAGKLTTKAVAEPVEIVVTAYVKADPEASANYTVTLVPAAASAVIEGAHYVNMAKDKTIQLTGKVLPASAMQEGTWKSSAVKVATVDADGLVTFLKPGTVTITFTASDGSKKTASVKITAGEPVDNLTITGAETLASGSKTTLKAAPTVKGLAWSSSNPAAATVSSTGAVIAKTVYETTVVIITAETTDGSNVKAEHTITITPKAKDMAIRQNGKIVSGTTLYMDSDAGFLFLEAPEGSKWTSSAAKVAEVNDGIVKILKAGTATITAKSADGKQSAKVTLKISKLVNTMTLTASGETTLISGKGKVTIKAAVNSDAKTKTVTWASSDPSVASVSTTGVVTAKAGVMKNTEVTITATAKDGSDVSEIIKVTVIPAATAVSIRSESAVTTADGISIRVGETLNGRTITLSKDVKIDLGAKVFPNALGAYADQTVTWKSSAAKVAKVDENGVVTALKAGTVTITVKTADGKTNTVKIKFV